MPGQHSCSPGSARLQRLYCVLPCQGNKVVSLWECPPSTFVLCFDTLWDHARATKLFPWECPPSTFVLCFTRFETMPGQHSCSPGSARLQRLYCVLHALINARVAKLIPWGCPPSTFVLCFTRFDQCQGSKVDSLGVPAFNVCIVFYTLWDHARATKLFPWECPPSTFALCFTRVETMPGKQT
jgi:hypothetical protein